MKSLVPFTALAVSTIALTACGSGDSHPKSSTPSTVASSTSSTATSSAGSPSSSSSHSPAISQSQAETSLQRVGGQDATVVKVNDGYEGASSDAQTMHFWKLSGSTWQKDGDVQRITAFSPSIQDKITGRLLPGASHAAFILDAAMGGTGSSPNSQVFVHDASQWGSVAQKGTDGVQLVDTGRSSDNMIGAWYQAKFGNGTLELGSFETQSDNADGYTVWKSWKLNGTQLEPANSTTNSGSATYRASSWAFFSSPSGKNMCSMQDGSVNCYVSATAQRDSGGKSLVVLDSNGASFGDGDMPFAESLGQGGDWATDGSVTTPPANGNVYTLPYGSSITDGNITCSSSSNGFTCTNSAGGFSVNAEHVSTR